MFGAALSSSGLGRRTTLGGSALVIGANLPDLDVLAFLGGPLADLEWRRGWSHGILALAILPFVLTGGLILTHRIKAGRQLDSRTGPEPTQLLLLSSLAILSHPILDTLNTYGVRWLMPFSNKWYYGDALFIVDPWAWLMLGAGWLWASRRRKRGWDSVRPPRAALIMFMAYAVSMWTSGAIARESINRVLEARFGHRPSSVMAGPIPVTPFSRRYVATQEDRYLVGSFSWLARPRVDEAIQVFPRTRPSHPALALAESTLVFQRFLGWARFPTFIVESAGDREYLVQVVDLRYATRPRENFGTLTVSVTVPR